MCHSGNSFPGRSCSPSALSPLPSPGAGSPGSQGGALATMGRWALLVYGCQQCPGAATWPVAKDG